MSKKNLIFLVASVFSLLLLFYLYLLDYSAVSVLNMAGKGKGPVIVIDAGHGGRDPGACVNGVFEKSINLDIAKKLRRQLLQRGYTVILTRATDTSITKYKVEGSYQKASLLKRAAIANKYNAAIMVSLHCNSDRNSNFSGAQVYYYNVSEKGKKLALAIQEEFAYKHLTERGVAVGDYSLFRNTAMPTVIVEAGFLSNKNDRSALTQSWYQDKVAQAITLGIDKYF